MKNRMYRLYMFSSWQLDLESELLGKLEMGWVEFAELGKVFAQKQAARYSYPQNNYSHNNPNKNMSFKF